MLNFILVQLVSSWFVLDNIVSVLFSTHPVRYLLFTLLGSTRRFIVFCHHGLRCISQSPKSEKGQDKKPTLVSAHFGTDDVFFFAKKETSLRNMSTATWPMVLLASMLRIELFSMQFNELQFIECDRSYINII